MKIKSLILGSVAAAGLSTAAMAADLGTVLTSLDVCDALGISGLTISSDTNCLSITGGVAYSFKFGDYNGSQAFGDATIPDDDFVVLTTVNNDWDSNVDAWLKFVGTADSSFGPASATIKLDFDQDYDYNNETLNASLDRFRVEEAYVSIGDTTVLMAGLKGSIANWGDDKPLNWLGLFHSNWVDTGVRALAQTSTGGHVIQVTSDLGNGVSVAGGLEDLGGLGSAVGVLAYSGNGVDAHVTVAADDILTGAISTWEIHTGITATMDMFTIGGAVAFDSNSYWNALGTASATFDMFTLAASVEGTSTNEFGFGVSASADVTEGVTINAGFSWFDTDTTVANTEGYQAAVQLVADVTETITLTGEVGIWSENTTPDDVFYGAGKVAWAPGGGFTSSVEGKYYANGAYSVEFKAAKDFE